MHYVCTWDGHFEWKTIFLDISAIAIDKSDCNSAKKNKNKRQSIVRIYHPISENHCFHYDHAVVFNMEQNLTKRLFEEMVHIHKFPYAGNDKTDTKNLFTIYCNISDKIKIPPDRMY